MLLLPLIVILSSSLTANIVFKDPNAMLHYVKKLLPQAPQILEAGGHFGEDTIKMKKIWPNATIHVFEPLPSSFEKMQNQTNNLKNVTCYPYALTTYSGETNFYIDLPNNAASSIGHPIDFNKSEFDLKPIKVPCKTIKQWVIDNNISQIGFMWLDMEGHELQALSNAGEILNTVKAIWTEISFVPIRQDSCAYQDLKKFLELHGFIESCRYGNLSVTSKFADALYVKKKLYESIKYSANKPSYK